MNLSAIITLIFIVLLISYGVRHLRISGKLLLFLLPVLLIINIIIASSIVYWITPGDYVVYTNFFQACQQSYQKCENWNTYEPMFFYLTYFLTNILGIGPHETWIIFASLYLSTFLTAIIVFAVKLRFHSGVLLSTYIILSVYMLTNFATLAIRFGLSFSIFLLSLSILYSAKISLTRIGAGALVILAILFHYQTIFMAFLPILLITEHNVWLRKFFPTIGSQIRNRLRLSLDKRWLYVMCLTTVVAIVVVLNLSQTLLLAKKGYYLSGYESSTLGIRPIIETMFITFVIIKPIGNTAISQYNPEYLKMYKAIRIFAIISGLIAVLSGFVFSIDGFSRQVQAAFVCAIIIQCSRLTHARSRHTISIILVFIYIGLITFYSFYSDTSFAPLIN